MKTRDSTVSGGAGWRRQVAAGGALVLAACGIEMDPAGSARLAGVVVVSGPLRNARLSIDQIDLDSPSAANRAHIAELITDEHGRFGGDGGLAVGAFNGLILFTSHGGSYQDLATGETIDLDDVDQLRTVTYLDLLEQRDDVLVSPIGHLIDARMRALLPGVPAQPARALAAHAAATASVSAHFGRVVDWTRLRLTELDQPVTSPTEPVRAAFVHAALSYLVADIAAAAAASPHEVSVLALTRQWATDLGVAAFAGDPLVFDGNDRNAKGSGLQLGVCPPVPAECRTASACDLGEPTGACRSACDLYAGTARALLGGVILEVIRDPDVNRTQVGAADMLPVLRAISESSDRALFGDGICTETPDQRARLLVHARRGAGSGPATLNRGGHP